MVKVRAATVASVMVLLGATLSVSLADDSWGDMAQYTSGSSVSQQSPTTSWAASKSSDKTSEGDGNKSDDDNKSDNDNKSDDDATDAPSNAWTPAPASGNSNEAATTDAPTNSWTQPPSGNGWSEGPALSGKSGDDNDDDKSDSPSSGDGKNSWSQSSKASSKQSSRESDKDTGDDDDNNDTTSSESADTSDSNETSSKQEPVSGSQTSGDDTLSTGSQTTGGGGGGSTTPSTSGGTVPDGTWPTSTGSVKFTEPRIIKAGEVFDGKMQTFDRSDITCTGGEGQKDTAVFLLEAGGTLKNAIIGKNQKEGVHCDDHDCTIDNVWWDDVCEDALSIKGGSASSVTTVTNSGARSADDKVVQHNGMGTVNIDGFYAEDFGKLYRSCGTCGDIPRIVTVKNVYAVNPKVSVITVNKNYGDKATLSNIWVKSSGGDEVKVCQWSQGGKDPTNLGDGPSPPLCQYSESDVHINQDISQAGGSTPSKNSAPAASSADSSTSQTQSTDSPATSPESSGDDDGGDDNSDTPVTSPESSGDDDGGDDNSDTPATSTAGSQTSWSQPPTSSGNNDNGNTEPDTPTTSSDGSQTSSNDTPSTGSKTTGGGGGSTTPSTGGGTVPDGTWPTSTGTVQYAEAHVIKAGEVFDGKMQTFERSDVTCEGQTESGSNTAVFLVEAGGTLKNAIIGKNQMEGVHCDDHDCTIDNVWWDDVCEDALSIKGGTASSVSTVTGGGARSADDKVIQHNGFGTVNIDGFYGEDISKLYRSCGTCGDKARKVSVSNVYIVNPDNAVVTVNKNWGDEATLSNIWIKSTGDKVKICQWSQGNADGEPKMLGDGPSPPLCQYSESDVHLNGDVSQAGGSSTPTKGSTPAASTESSVDGGETPSTEESSGDDDGGSETSSPTESSKNGDGGDDDNASPATSSESSGNGEEEETEAPTESSDDNKKSDGDNKDSSSDDSTQQNDQETPSDDDQSVTQQEVSGEATAWNETDTATPTAVKSASDVKEPTLESMPTTTSAKCNIRRKRN